MIYAKNINNLVIITSCSIHNINIRDHLDTLFGKILAMNPASGFAKILADLNDIKMNT